MGCEIFIKSGRLVDVWLVLLEPPYDATTCAVRGLRLKKPHLQPRSGRPRAPSSPL